MLVDKCSTEFVSPPCSIIESVIALGPAAETFYVLTFQCLWSKGFGTYMNENIRFWSIFHVFLINERWGPVGFPDIKKLWGE